MEQGVKVAGIDHGHRFLLGTHALVHQVAGNLQGSLGRPLAVPGLEHVQLAVLHGELHVLHIPVMVLQGLADILELLKSLGELVRHLGNLHRGADACHHVLALCVGQELAEQALLAGSRIAGERNAGAAVIAHVAEGHGLHVYGSAPGIRDVVVAAVYIGAGVVPGTEHGLDGAHELLFRIVRESAADFTLVLGLELSRQFLQVVSGELYILLHALLLLHGVDELLEVLLAHLHDHIGVHLDEPSVAVPCPAGIAGFLGDDVHNVLVQAQVQDGIHHAGHGSPCAGTDGHQQRILLVAELFAGNLLHLDDVFIDLALNLIVDFSSVLVILCTGLRGNRKALRHRKAQPCHLGQVRALAAQKLTHVGIAFREQVHPFSHRNLSLS